MGKLLDRLAKRLWVPWLACVGLGAASVALDAAGYDGIALILRLAVVTAMLVVLLDYLGWYWRARHAVGAAELRKQRSVERDWPLLALVFASMLATGAVYAYDLTHDIIMPLAASVMVPLSLRQRSALISAAATPQPAR